MLVKERNEHNNIKVLFIMEEQERKVIEGFVREDIHRNWIMNVYKDGEDIIEMTNQFQPDIVLLSISYDGASGLQMLQKIRKMHGHLPICVFSDVHSPDIFSKLALCGIDGYLSLPVKRHQLKVTMETLVEIVDNQRKIRKEEHSLLVEQEIAGEVLENGFVYSILFDMNDKEKLSEYCEWLKLGKTGRIMCLQWKQSKFDEDYEKQMYEQMRNIIKQSLGSHTCAIGPRIFQRMIVYISSTITSTGENLTEQEVREMTENLKKSGNEIVKEMKVYIGGEYPVDTIYKSYQEAIGKENMKPVDWKIRSAKNERFYSYREYGALVNRLLDVVKTGRDEASEVFKETLEWLRILAPEAKKNKVIQLLLLCCHAAYVDGDNELEFLNCEALVQESAKITDIDQWANKKMEYIVNSIQEYQSRNTSSTVKVAIDYIEKNYDKEISLEDVAKQVGVTPQHFSKIFKLETGTNYVDWVTELRMEQAKKYLLRGKHTMKEVCFLVGYKDPNYFSRIFKRIVGMPPREYVKHQQREGL